VTAGIQESFDRIARIKVYPRLTLPGYSGMTAVTLPAGYQYSSRQDDGTPGLRMRFRIEKIKEITPNHVNFWIYNLGKTSRTIFKKDSLIEISAGYGTSTGVIFRGDILRVRTVKEGPDYVTHIESGDGIFATQNSHVDLPFKTPITSQAIVATLVSTLKLAGIDVGQVMALIPNVYNNGIVISGRTVDRLKEICEQNNLECSIQDGKIFILPYGTPKVALPVLISSGASVLQGGTGLPNTGLIGIPELREPGAESTLVSFKTLLNYNIGVFQPVLLSSKFINGAFVALKVTHEGDTWEGPWYTEVEAAGPGAAEVSE